MCSKFSSGMVTPSKFHWSCTRKDWGALKTGSVKITDVFIHRLIFCTLLKSENLNLYFIVNFRFDGKHKLMYCENYKIGFVQILQKCLRSTLATWVVLLWPCSTFLQNLFPAPPPGLPTCSRWPGCQSGPGCRSTWWPGQTPHVNILIKT